MKKFQNLLSVPPELRTGEDKSYLIKSFLLQDILKEESQVLFISNLIKFRKYLLRDFLISF